MISLLIMDVSGSTKAAQGLSKEIKWLEKEISDWLAHQEKSYVNYRMGDELFIISSKPHYTLSIAFYAKLLWRKSSFPLKCSFHTIAVEYADTDPDECTHAGIKDTRTAIDDFAGVDVDSSVGVALMYVTDISNSPTELQRGVLLLKMSGLTQKEIAETLNKSHSTISAHYQKSRGRQLEVIQDFLQSYYE